jgi:phosphoribosyl-AMP cyclohydrolase
MKPLEEGTELTLDFSKIARSAAVCPDIIPVAVQHADTGEVILLAYTNEQAFRQAVDSRRLVLWSTSRNELWEKGRTSGETFDLIEVYVNCEQNALLYKVRPRRAPRAPGGRAGGICHTQNRQGEPRHCFYRRLDLNTQKLQNVDP